MTPPAPGFRDAVLKVIRYNVADAYMGEIADAIAALHTQAVKSYADLLLEYTQCPPEFEDERMKYVTVQVDKGLLKAAKSLLGGAS